LSIGAGESESTVAVAVRGTSARPAGPTRPDESGVAAAISGR
jgi:hypothetical protein